MNKAQLQHVSLAIASTDRARESLAELDFQTAQVEATLAVAEATLALAAVRS